MKRWSKRENDWHRDPRCRALGLQGAWVYEYLWGRCGEEKREALPAYLVDPETVSVELGGWVTPDEVYDAILSMERVGLARTLPDGGLYIWGYHESHKDQWTWATIEDKRALEADGIKCEVVSLEGRRADVLSYPKHSRYRLEAPDTLRRSQIVSDSIGRSPAISDSIGRPRETGPVVYADNKHSRYRLETSDSIGIEEMRGDERRGEEISNVPIPTLSREVKVRARPSASEPIDARSDDARAASVNASTAAGVGVSDPDEPFLHEPEKIDLDALARQCQAEYSDTGECEPPDDAWDDDPFDGGDE